MPKSGSGPRDYTAGTERALYAFSGMACYFPDCTTPVIIFVGDEPVCNVQIAHVYGANANSPRYDPSMTNDERRAFANLVLLCQLCRRRHNWHYAELLVMPTYRQYPLVTAR